MGGFQFEVMPFAVPDACDRGEHCELAALQLDAQPDMPRLRTGSRGAAVVNARGKSILDGSGLYARSLRAVRRL